MLNVVVANGPKHYLPNNLIGRYMILHQEARRANSLAYAIENELEHI